MNLSRTSENGKVNTFFLRNMNRFPILIGLLIIVYLGSRLFALQLLPPFVDEAIRIQWARETLQGDLMAGMWDGTWLSIKILALFAILPVDPVLSGRLAAVIVSIATLIGCILVGNQLYSKKVGLVSGIVYILLPYVLFYNRVTITDNFLTAFGVWILFISILLIRSPKLIFIILLVLFLIGAILTKLSGFLFIPVPLAAVIFLTPYTDWRKHILAMVPAVLSAVLLLAVFYWKGQGGMYQFQSAAGSDWSVALVQDNIMLMLAWFWDLLTPPVAILTGVALIWLAIWGRNGGDWVLASMLFVSIAPYVINAKWWSPRYMLPAVVPLSLLIARFLCVIEERVNMYIQNGQWQHPQVVRSILVGLTAFALIIWPTLFNISIVTMPHSGRLPDVLHSSFYTGWTSGYGLAELVAYLKEQEASQPDGINVLRFLYWDHPSHGLDLYLDSSESLTLYTLDPLDPELSAKVQDLAADRPTFLVANPSYEDNQKIELPFTIIDESLHIFSSLEGVQKVWHHPRPGGQNGFEVWELYAAGQISGDNQVTRSTQ